MTQMMNHSMNSGAGGQGDAVSQLVAHNTRTEAQTKKRDREEFLRRMNVRKEFPKIEARTADQLLEELEKFEEFLVDAKPKDSFETLEYMKASLKRQRFEALGVGETNPRGTCHAGLCHPKQYGCL